MLLHSAVILERQKREQMGVSKRRGRRLEGELQRRDRERRQIEKRGLCGYKNARTFFVVARQRKQGSKRKQGWGAAGCIFYVSHGILFRKNNDKRLDMRETGRRASLLKNDIMKNNVALGRVSRKGRRFIEIETQCMLIALGWIKLCISTRCRF